MKFQTMPRPVKIAAQSDLLALRRLCGHRARRAWSLRRLGREALCDSRQESAGGLAPTGAGARPWRAYPTTIDASTAQREALMMGLRLTEGITLQRWQGLFSQPLTVFLPASKLQKLLDEGLLRLSETALAATAEGRQRLNAVLRYLLA